jgi:hypothetical protein
MKYVLNARVRVYTGAANVRRYGQETLYIRIESGQIPIALILNAITDDAAHPTSPTSGLIQLVMVNLILRSRTRFPF